MYIWLFDIKILNLICLKIFIYIVCVFFFKISLFLLNIFLNYMFELFNENLGWVNKFVVKVINYVFCIIN